METSNSDIAQAQNVCKYFKYGFCKFRSYCKAKHVDEICTDLACTIEVCNKRHPRECSYFREYGRCKFGTFCCYRHIASINNQSIIDMVESTVDEVKNLRLEIDKLTELVNAKSQEIDNLNKKIYEQETKINSVRSIEEKCENADKRIKDLGDNYFILLHSVDDLEKSVKTIQMYFNRRKPNFTCSFCGAVCQDDSTLRNHLLNVHNT